MGNTKNDDLLSNPNLDKLEEYVRLKGVIRTLRTDIKDIKESLEPQIELDKLNKKVRELREKIKGDETIFELTEKLKVTKERLDLIKELIRMDMMDNGLEELKGSGFKFKLVNIVKEWKDDGRESIKDKEKKNITEDQAAKQLGLEE